MFPRLCFWPFLKIGARFAFLQLLKTSPAPQDPSKVTECPYKGSSQCMSSLGCSLSGAMNTYGLSSLEILIHCWSSPPPPTPASQRWGLPWWWQLASARAALDTVCWSKGRSRQIEVTPGAFREWGEPRGQDPFAGKGTGNKRKNSNFVKNALDKKTGQVLKDFWNNGRKLPLGWATTHGQRRVEKVHLELRTWSHPPHQF